MEEAIEPRRGSGVVRRRDYLHRRDLHKSREADLRQGASLRDPKGLFNASLEGNARRAIDIHEGDQVDAAALKDLIRAAVALNLQGKRKPVG